MIASGGVAMTDYFLNALVTLFVTIDPVGLAPIFMALTTGMAPAARRQAALRASLIAASVLVAFALVGEALIGFLGVSLPAFRIAGGLLLFVIAFEMVFGRKADRAEPGSERTPADRDPGHDLAVFPLAIPLISGPGAISATILLASGAANYLALGGLIVIIVVLIGVCYAVFQLANRIERALGNTGRLVVTRLLGVILAALAVQFVADGVMAISRGL
jgi:multiple antibiotic resistance protein